MNKILRLTFVALLAMVASFSFAQTTITFDPATDKGANNKKADKGSVTKDGVTIETSNGMLGAYNQGTDVYEYRFYKNYDMTVTSTVGAITKVVFTCTASGTDKHGPGCFELSEGSTGNYTYEGNTGTWEGAATTFSLTASTNQVRCTKIEVTVSTSGSVVAAPSISGEESFYDKTTVTITASEGADIYYTVDGTDPTTSSTKYVAPFDLTETTTVKAMAAKGGKASDVVSKIFTKKAKLTLEGDGTETNPYTVKDALAIINANEQTKDSVFVVGYVKEDAEFESKYGDCNFDLVYDINGTDAIYAYAIKDEKGAAFKDATKLKAGTKVMIKSVLTSFNGKAELNRGHIVSYTPTGISKIETSAAKAVRYNLAGQKVGANYKGVVIENGKKIVVK